MSLSLSPSPALTPTPRKGKYPNAVSQKRPNADKLLRQWMKRNVQTMRSESNEPITPKSANGNGNGHSVIEMSQWTRNEMNYWSKRLRSPTDESDIEESKEDTFDFMQKHLKS